MHVKKMRKGEGETGNKASDTLEHFLCVAIRKFFLPELCESFSLCAGQRVS